MMKFIDIIDCPEIIELILKENKQTIAFNILVQIVLNVLTGISSMMNQNVNLSSINVQLITQKLENAMPVTEDTTLEIIIV